MARLRPLTVSGALSSGKFDRSCRSVHRSYSCLIKNYILGGYLGEAKKPRRSMDGLSHCRHRADSPCGGSCPLRGPVAARAPRLPLGGGAPFDLRQALGELGDAVLGELERRGDVPLMQLGVLGYRHNLAVDAWPCQGEWTMSGAWPTRPSGWRFRPAPATGSRRRVFISTHTGFPQLLAPERVAFMG